eukprot:8558002-Alexandrium_andersonii.AAC.1
MFEHARVCHSICCVRACAVVQCARQRAFLRVLLCDSVLIRINLQTCSCWPRQVSSLSVGSVALQWDLGSTERATAVSETRLLGISDVLGIGRRRRAKGQHTSSAASS